MLLRISQAVVLKCVLRGVLREAMAGSKDLVEEAAFGSEAAKAPGAGDAAAVEVGETSRHAPVEQAAKHEAESCPDFARLASAVKAFRAPGLGMSEAYVWCNLEGMEEVVEDFMHQAGAL